MEDEKDLIIESLQQQLVELAEENEILHQENEDLKNQVSSTRQEQRIGTSVPPPGDDAPPLSIRKIKKLVVIYEKQEDDLVKLFLNNLEITMSEKDRYILILNTFYNIEKEIEKFHQELEGELVETLTKRARGRSIDALKFKNSANFKRFSSIYFLLQKKNICKRVMRKTRIQNGDFLKRTLEDSNLIDILYEFFHCDVKFDETDKHLIGKRFLKNCHQRYGNCEGFIIAGTVAPALIDDSEGDLLKKTIVVTESVQAKRSRGPPPRGRLQRSRGGRGGGGLMNFPKRGLNPGLLKAASTINLGGGLIQTEKTRRMEVKRRESAVAVKEEKIKRKEERLKEREEELKRREEALSLFEKDLQMKENQMNIDHEERKKEMQKQIEELEEQKEERIKRRKAQALKRRKIVVKRVKVKKRSVSMAMGEKERGKIVGKMTEEEEEDDEGDAVEKVEEEEKGCPKSVNEIVLEYMELDNKFSGLSREHFSHAREYGPKNRYADILPYNHNFVNIGKKGYINASDCKIHGITYFAAQWPLVSDQVDCEGDWWEMVYRHKCKVIIALQKPGPPKHPYYWPRLENQTKDFKRVVVKNTSLKVTQNYHEIRVKVMKKGSKGLFRKKSKDDSKSVESTIYVYTKWPDMGLPDDFDSLHEVMVKSDEILLDPSNRVKVKVGKKGKDTEMREPPMVVHCSAGVGRTGVFICCHSHLRRKLGIGTIKDTLFRMRKERNHMVQNVKQYQYCFDFIWKYSQK